ncbi:hypothetical protein PSTT_04844 [Puccinia striiformis]|uniref:Uncharacterized protein n=2 Tax=Puccinia striiformis TaxID=27350 RepID=A0A2S4VRA4_9BASI|nr:hypothetical protein PSTT_04844 [Puccinia striiformis]
MTMLPHVNSNDRPKPAKIELTAKLNIKLTTKLRLTNAVTGITTNPGSTIRTDCTVDAIHSGRNSSLATHSRRMLERSDPSSCLFSVPILFPKKLSVLRLPGSEPEVGSDGASSFHKIRSGFTVWTWMLSSLSRDLVRLGGTRSTERLTLNVRIVWSA